VRASVTIQLGEAEIALRGDRTLFYPRAGTLILADVHVGKTATFLTHGLPVPEGNMEDDLARWSRALHDTAAVRCVIAGDLYHGATAARYAIRERLAAWIGQQTARFDLVSGNHDRGQSEIVGLNDVGDRLDVEALTVVHDPTIAPGNHATVCGHLHPTLALGAGGRMKAPIFWQRGLTLILPAFGSFTGGKPVTTRPAERVWAAKEGRIDEIPPALRSWQRRVGSATRRAKIASDIAAKSPRRKV
jgi:uncharacterized protein